MRHFLWNILRTLDAAYWRVLRTLDAAYRHTALFGFIRENRLRQEYIGRALKAASGSCFSLIDGFSEVVAECKKSDTLFVLGSGSSVNRLTSAQWEHVSQHDSVGFNFWPVHDYIPTFFFFEPSPNAERNRTFYELMKLRSEAYRDVPVVLDYRWWEDIGGWELEELEHVCVGSRLFLHVPFRFETSDAGYMQKLMRLWLWLRPYEQRSLCDGIIHHRGTLSALFHFAWAAKYSRIVTIGVDLNDSAYFWEELPEAYSCIPHPPNVEQKVGIHGTADPDQYAGNTLPIDEYLFLFQKMFLKPSRRNEVYVSHASSRLYPNFPVYPPFRDVRDDER